MPGVLGDPGERRLVGRDHARAAAALDRHVADGHAALHRERLDRRAGELDDVAGGAVDAHLADRREDEVLGGDAEAELARVADAHRARLGRDEALRRQHVLDLARADPEGERAERAVRRRVAVAADDRHAGLRDAELGPDDVDDALALGAQRVDRDAELLAVGLERLDLHAAELVLDERDRRRAVGRHVVVGGGQRAVGAADRAAGEPQPVEGLRARDLVDEVQVDPQQARRDLVGGPDLVEQRRRAVGCGHGCQLLRRPAETTASRIASSSPGFSKWWGRSASKVTQSPSASSWRSPSMRSTTRPACDERGLAAAGLVHRRVAGTARARVRRPARGARARRAGRAAAG